MKSVLALDLASVSGWSFGEPGGTPDHGTIRFASSGASHEAVFAGAMNWMRGLLAVRQINIVVWEAPLAASFKRGTTNINTTTLLYGLPAVIGAVAYHSGIHDLYKADTKAVRLHFIGGNPPRDVAKKLTKYQCGKMGWKVSDDNEADALATWSYMCSLLEPKLAVLPMPLFGAA
jgi:hypothetical protein